MGYTGVALNPQHEIALPSPVAPPASGAVSPAAMRRVLRRARDGVALNVDEAAIAVVLHVAGTAAASGCGEK